VSDWVNKCHFGDVRAVLRRMIAAGVKVQTIVTSPPYWGLRDYGVEGQLGLERTLPEFLANQVEVFELAKQVLADDGTAWVNMGDSYAANRGAQPAPTNTRNKTGHVGGQSVPLGIKPKDLVGQPWRLAFALQDAGWWLRSDIIWHKPNPMPESCKDRPTKAHEYLFLLAKSERYHFDFEAFQEPVTGTANPRVAGWASSTGAHTAIAHNTPKASKTGVGFGRGFDHVQKPRVKNNASMDAALIETRSTRNRRTVWTIPTQGYEGAHFATFPEALVEPCILAGCPVGGTVLDIYFGSGTTGQVAQNLGRNWIGIELNEANRPLQDQRLQQSGLHLEAA